MAFSSILVLTLFQFVLVTGIDYPLPPEWKLAPNSITDFPIVKESGKKYYKINPWNYTQRIGLYKCILNTTDKYMKSLGLGGELNILWGLPVQLGWQHLTGRLKDLTNKTTCGMQGPDINCISPLSWWASVNYFLSAVPFIGALNAGIIHHSYPVQMDKPNINITTEQEKFCFSAQDCGNKYNRSTTMWTSFFMTLKTLAVQTLNSRKNSDNVTPVEDILLKGMWTAHMQSLNVTLKIFANKVKYFSAPERKFALSWANLVYFIAKCHFVTDFNHTASMQYTLLPKRLLLAGDNPPFVKDFSQDVNACIFITEILRDTNVASDGLVLDLWSRAMCSPKGRADGRFFLTHAITQPSTLIGSFIDLLGDILKSPGC